MGRTAQLVIVPGAERIQGHIALSACSYGPIPAPLAAFQQA